MVVPTVIEPLRADWELVQGQVKELRDEGNHAGALSAVRIFHHKLCTTRVLDPACGTGNFLYVSLELMKRLEGEVLEALDDLGEDQARLSMEGETVNPKQFYGLEVNPRAVPIADLVLWIGYLKWQLKTAGLTSIHEPVLHAYGTIKQQDAVIAYDRRGPMHDTEGRPISRWDGVTTKVHPITGEDVPDPNATIPVYSYINPRRAAWPEVEFIVGNPPFIGAKDMRAELGDGYAEACWKARPEVPGGADFVMHFWNEAATRLLRNENNPLRRFGFITTNSITQTFSRRLIEHHTSVKDPLSLVFAVPNHPWLKASDKAAVRIAMTVAEKGEHGGRLSQVVSEAGLNSDTPQVQLETTEGIIRSKLMIGADLGSVRPLVAAAYMGHKGMMPYGEGFWIDSAKAGELRAEGKPNYPHRIRPYLNGSDLTRRPRGVFAIDFLGLSAETAQEWFPKAYSHLYEHVRPQRETNNRKSRWDRWWVFAEPALDMRDAVRDIKSFIATTETAKHRTFSLVSSDYLADQKIRVVSSDRYDLLSVLSSRVHVVFSISKGGWQGVGNDPVYQHTQTFDPFPFPNAVSECSPSSSPALAQHERLHDLGRRLDAFRKDRIAEHAFLTVTGLYNALERLRELENGCNVPALTDSERDVHQAGLISVLKEIHDDIDRAVLTAYGWEDLIPAIVGRPGSTLPSPHKTLEQEKGEERLLTRLVALNHERLAEERRGLVRWLRPDYQVPKLGLKAPKAEGEQTGVLDVTLPEVAKRPKWPADGLDQIRVVRDVLAKAIAPTPSNAIASLFDGRNTAKRQSRIGGVLETLIATGLARTADHEGQRRYFLPR